MVEGSKSNLKVIRRIKQWRKMDSELLMKWNITRTWTKMEQKSNLNVIQSTTL